MSQYKTLVLLVRYLVDRIVFSWLINEVNNLRCGAPEVGQELEADCYLRGDTVIPCHPMVPLTLH